jgi:SAM-dependent methyltransferase
MGLVESVFHPFGGWRPAADAELIYDKACLITRYAAGKRVLDAGCGGGPGDTALQSEIAGAAGYYAGVELDAGKTSFMREKGFNVIQGDVQTVELHEKFDVVYAGEIIEHLSNPGMFLDNMARHLSDDGVLIITTPNFYFSSMLLRLLSLKEIPINPEHTCWFDPTTIRALAKRHGFQPERVIYYQSSPRLLMNLLAKLNHRTARSIILIARKK